MDVVMTPEERAEMEAAEKGTTETAAGTASPAPTSSTPAGTDATPATPPTDGTVVPPTEQSQTSLAHHSSFSSSSKPPTPSASSSQLSSTKKEGEKGSKGKKKLTPEQQAKLDALEKKQEEEKLKRVEALKEKLVQRIRPFVDAKNPGDINDPETKAFELRIKTEAEDLKLESFGVELLHTISQVYITKAANFVKSRKFFGGGFFGRLKEKGGMVKEGWGLLGSAIGVQAAMEEMERLEQKGTATPEELEALAQEVSSKMLLTTWRATRWEVINVVGAVVDAVLYEPNLNKETSLRRAKAILTIGGIFKNVQADESDEERRELERLVMNAGNKKSKAAKEKEAGKEKEKEKKGWGFSVGHTQAEKKEEPNKPAP